MPYMDDVEEYLRSVEAYFYSSLLAVTYNLPDVHEVVNQLWVDISRYGPGLPSFPEVHIPTLGDFQVPPPPPPPPPVSTSWITRSTHWIDRHPWKSTGLVIGVVGAGLLVGYGRLVTRRRYLRAQTQVGQYRQVVVVLGGDTPFALPIILELERKGYIVITSVSNSEATDSIEAQCKGYVKALVLDPFEPETIQPFLRSLAAALSRKFPIKSAGDPYASPSSIPHLHSVISLLSLSAPVPNIYAPLEHISLRNTYVSYLTATQITPLQVIQALLPLLRTGSTRSRDIGKQSIVVCLPATDAHVGLPFASVQAMSAAGMLRAIEVLRREINITSLTDKADSMQNIKVVIVDVGSFNIEPATKAVLSESIYKSMENWSASEKLVYGPAFMAVVHEKPPIANRWDRIKSIFQNGYQYGVPRKPTDLSVLARGLVDVVDGSSDGPKCFGYDIGLGFIHNWIRGDRFSVGAGATTYKLASHLPSLLLDGLLKLPFVLISIRNRLLPIQPFRGPPSELPPQVEVKEEPHDSPSSSEVENSSDADVESNAEDTVESSWVSLKQNHTDA